MRLRLFGAVLAALVLSLPAVAQEQRATLEGSIVDQSGAPAPGTAVEIKNASGAVLTTVAGGNGIYRFPSISPGVWDVSASLPGFRPAKVSGVTLALGQVLQVNLTLTVGGMAEIVQIVGEAPLIDVKQSARVTSIREEQIEKLPKGRNFTTLVTQAPGANPEAKLGGISIDGSSAAENRFIIDGTETTDIRYGTSGKDLITDFVEEVQVKSSGYTAEYGGATGGVINVITKSGTNTFKGDVETYFSGDALGYECTDNTGDGGGYCDGRPSLRRVPANTALAEKVEYQKDSIKRWDPGFNLSGPILKDKLWFFAGYQPRLQNIERTWTANADNVTRTSTRKYRQHFMSANVTGQPSSTTRFRLAYNNSHYKREGNLPTLDGNTSPLANLAVTRVSPNWSTSATFDYTPTSRWLMSVRGGYFTYDDKDEGVYQKDRYVFGNSNIGLAGVPAEFQRPSGTQNQTGIRENSRDKYTRFQTQFDTTYFFTGAGQHEMKAGLLYDRRANDALYGDTANTYTFRWNQTISGQRGQLGYYQVRSNRTFPERGYLEVGKIHTNSAQVFLQDSWTMARRFTLNIGVRTENEVAPSYADPIYGFASDAIKFGFKDKLAPRVGFAWDLKGDGRWKVYGSWGIFYDILKLDLARGSFGGAKWVEYYYALDTPNWPSLIDLAGCPPACPGKQLLFRDFRFPSNDAIQSDIKPMKLQEYVAGVEHELAAKVSVSARYVHKQIDRAIEDIGNLDAAGNETYVIGNPGFGSNAVYIVPGTGASVALPKAKRDYDAVELALNRRLASNWSARVSYLWSRLSGNYTGLSESDENGRVSPNVGRSFDYPLMMFNESAQPVFGVLPTDRTHQGKVQALYDAPFGVSIGANLFVASGLPITRDAAFVSGSNYPVQYLGRNSDGRTPFFRQLDLYAQYDLKLGGRKRVTLSANVLNAFGTRTATNRWSTQLQPGSAIDVTEAQFFAGVNTQSLIASQKLQQDPRFLQDFGYQRPREARFGVRFAF